MLDADGRQKEWKPVRKSPSLRCLKVPLQQDGHSCGPFAFLHVCERAAELSSSVFPSDRDVARVCIVYRLYLEVHLYSQLKIAAGRK